MSGLSEEDYARDDDVILASGSRFHVRVAPFDKSRALFKTVIREVMGVVPVDLFNRDAKTFVMQALVIGSSSDAIERAADECLKYCTYNGLKFSYDLMKEAKNREDYIECLFHVCEANIRPFLKSLFVLSSGLAESTRETNTNSQGLQ